MQKKILECLKKIGNNNIVEYHPVIFDLSETHHAEELGRLYEEGRVVSVIDDISGQKGEYGIIMNPERMKSASQHETARIQSTEDVSEGRWIYYPWRHTLVHCIPEDMYHTVRLARNRELITSEEQTVLQKARICVLGLNVGYAGAMVCALEGIGSYFDLVDLDTLSVTNLNRFPAGLCDIGVNKAVLAARHMYELDPYLNITVHTKGLHHNESKDFLVNNKPDILIEEVDDLKLKIHVRKIAKELKIPVVMVTGNGPNIILDIERYDIEDVKMLNGLLDSSVQGTIEKQEGRFSFDEHVALARDFIGKKWLTERLQESFEKVGSTLAGIPQLGETTFLRGATLGYITRQILLKAPVPSGRYEFKLDEILI